MEENVKNELEVTYSNILIEENADDVSLTPTVVNSEIFETYVKTEKNIKFKFMKHILLLKQFLDSPQFGLAYLYHLFVVIIIFANIIYSFYNQNDTSLDFAFIFIQIFETVLRIWTSFISYDTLPRIKYLLSYSMCLDYFLVLLTFGLIYLKLVKGNDLTIFSILYALQSLKLLRINRYANCFFVLGKAIRKYHKELISTYVMSSFVIFSMAYAFYFVEKIENSNLKLSDSLYWSTITFLTIGFGDVSPVSYAGRLIISLLGIISVTIVLLPSVLLGTGLTVCFKKKEDIKNNIKLENNAKLFIKKYIKYFISLKKNYGIIYTNKIDNSRDSGLLNYRPSKHLNQNSTCIFNSFIRSTESGVHFKGSKRDIIQNEFIILPLERIKNEIQINQNLIKPTNIAVSFIYHLSMLVALKEFRKRKVSITHLEEMKVVTTLIKSLSTHISTLEEKQQTLNMRIDKIEFNSNNIANHLEEISKNIKNMSIKKEERDKI